MKKKGKPKATNSYVNYFLVFHIMFTILYLGSSLPGHNLSSSTHLFLPTRAVPILILVFSFGVGSGQGYDGRYETRNRPVEYYLDKGFPGTSHEFLC